MGEEDTLSGTSKERESVPNSPLARINRRVVARTRGGPDVLEIVEEPLPDPGPGEVRIAIEATGVSFADLLMREGVHPECPRGEITLGWDLVGHVEKIGAGVSGIAIGQRVAALPVYGGYADSICLRPEDLVEVPPDLDAAEAVSMVLNYMTAFQMLHRSAHVKAGQSVLIHGAAGGIGTALLQLSGLAGLTSFGTSAAEDFETVRTLGGTPIDYRSTDFVQEIGRLTGDGVDVVFDGIGGEHVWRSFKALRSGGTVVAFGLTSSLKSGRLVGGLRHRFKGLATIAAYMLASRLSLSGRRIVPYSIQRRMWAHRDEFRSDLSELFRLLSQKKIKPLIAARLPLSEVRRAHEMLAGGGVQGKIVLTCGQAGK